MRGEPVTDQNLLLLFDDCHEPNGHYVDEKKKNEIVAVPNQAAANPVPIQLSSSENWISGIKARIDSERKRLESDGRLGVGENGAITIDPSFSEKFYCLLRTALDAVANLIGRKEQCGLSGYCAASAFMRGAIPALRGSGAAREFGITGLVLTTAYLVTTSVNFSTALSAYAKSYATQSEHLTWVINNLSTVETFIKAVETGQATEEQAAVFNQFMQHIENIRFLMSEVRLKEEVNESSATREGAAMLPGGVISEASSANGFTHAIPALNSAILSEFAPVFTILGGGLDIRQSLGEKEIARMNMAERKKNIESLTELGIVGNIGGFIKTFCARQESVVKELESQLTNTDFRLFKGAMAIPAGVAGLVFTTLSLLKAVGIVVLASAAIALTLTCLSALAGLILLIFLGRMSYVAYRGWQSAKASQNEIEAARTYISTSLNAENNSEIKADDESDPILSNPYFKLDQLAKILLNGAPDKRFENALKISDKEAKSILNAVGLTDAHISALLLEARNKGNSSVEWLKSQIGKYLNINYSFNEKRAGGGMIPKIPSSPDLKEPENPVRVAV